MFFLYDGYKIWRSDHFTFDLNNRLVYERSNQKEIVASILDVLDGYPYFNFVGKYEGVNETQSRLRHGVIEMCMKDFFLTD